MKRTTLLALICVVTLCAVLSGALGWTAQFIVVMGVFFIGASFIRHRLDLRPALVRAVALVAPWLLIYTSHVVLNSLSHVYHIAFAPLLATALAFGMHSVPTVWAMACVLTLSTAFSLTLGKDLLHDPEPSSLSAAAVSQISQLVRLADSESGGDLRRTVFYGWTTDCLPCYVTLPKLERYAHELETEFGVTLYPLLIQRNEADIEEAERFFSERGISLSQAVTTVPYQEFRSSMGFGGVPITIATNADAEIIYVGRPQYRTAAVRENVLDVVAELYAPASEPSATE